MFGERLKELREDQGLTQSDLANYLHISRPTITLYENNTNQPDFNTLIQIADKFNVSLDYLLGRTNQKYNINSLNKKDIEFLLYLYENKDILFKLYEIIGSYETLKK